MKLSNDSTKLFNFISQFKIRPVKFSKRFNKLYNDFITKYIDVENNYNVLNNLLTNREINTEKQCNFLRIIRHIYNTKLKSYLEMDLTLEEKDRLKNFISNLEHLNDTHCDNWINIYGTQLQKNFNMLVYYNKIPSNLLANDNVILDIYNRYCPINVQREIENKHKYIYRSVISYKNNIVKTTILSQIKPNKKLVHKINKRTLFMLSLDEEQSINILNIKFYLTNKKKILPTKYKILGSKEVNTGSTAIGINGGKINIWRKEELLKLIIHEMIHYKQFDFKSLDLDTKLHNIFNINDNIRIRSYEAYTEIWACILNSIFMSYDDNSSINYKLFKKFINYERLFSTFQIAKILNFYEIDNYNDFFRMDGNFTKIINWEQNTHIISYYIIKGALLYSLDKFIEFCETHNTNFILKFDDNNVEVLFQLILKCLSNNNFINKVNYFIKYIQNNKNNTIIFKTMRMTLFE